MLNRSIPAWKSRSLFYNFAILGLMLLAAFVMILAQNGLAFAHAHLKSASIAPDATLTSSPTTLILTFTEDTSPTQTKLQVLDSSGKQVDKGDLKVSGATATVSLNALLDGKYSVKFRSFTEEDSGIVDGAFSFTLATGGSASSGNLAKATEQESNVPASSPATGEGGSSRVAGSGPDSLQGEFGLVFLSLVAGIALMIYNRKRSVS